MNIHFGQVPIANGGDPSAAQWIDSVNSSLLFLINLYDLRHEISCRIKYWQRF